jgi:hypothetical protein
MVGLKCQSVFFTTLLASSMASNMSSSTYFLAKLVDFSIGSTMTWASACIFLSIARISLTCLLHWSNNPTQFVTILKSQWH